ncbi:LuxR C-terminal-related transcriptional regulator [Sorangium sp. So ce296]|uniref:LuxR C-terminal-related transcriptional regulator n=1 Tax=Sorangium sp. So ce296 TaxID=3133296 RepID=UPI003F621558
MAAGCSGVAAVDAHVDQVPRLERSRATLPPSRAAHPDVVSSAAQRKLRLLTRPDTACAIALHRSWGDRQYRERERRLIDVVHAECDVLHRPPEVPAALLAGLPPRPRDTFRGLGEEQIAAELRISQHTVHDDVKALHRRFGVQSRSELLALCLGQSPPGAAR